MNPNTFGRAAACALIAVLAILLYAQAAEAGGFAIRENSGSQLGNAFAGVPTNTEDISSIANNPGLLGVFDGINTSAEVSYIVPHSKFKNGEATSAPASGSVPITENNAFSGNDDIGRNAFVPATYLSASITDELKAGLAITAPFGLLTDNPAGWVGRYHALKSEVKTIDINPMLGYQVTDYLSIGAGFRAVYLDTELSQSIDFGSILFANTGGTVGSPTQQDGRAKLKGDDWGFGGNAGILFEAGKLYAPLEGLRFGLGYRSQVDIKVDGDINYKTVPVPLQGTFQDTDAKANVDLPTAITFGAQYDLNDQWAFMGQFEWTDWSQFKELRVKFEDGQQDSVTEEDWDDGYFLAAGTTYRPDWVEGLALRLGLAYEWSPVPDSTRTPRVPDNDRFWVATGINYRPVQWFSVDFGYSHIFMDDGDIDLEAESATDFRGSLSGKYETNIDIFALQANFTF